MKRTSLFSLLALVVLAFTASRAQADDRILVADALVKISATAESLAKTAGKSDGRAVRKKFAPAAQDLADDLAALSRRTRKDVPFDALVKDALGISKDALALVDLADESEDKDERKSLRAQAQALEQNVGLARKALEALAAAKPAAPAAPAAPAKPAPMKPDSFNALVSAVKSASFDDDKVAVVQGAARNNWFTSAQVASLVAIPSFGDGKVEVAVACWSKIVDPENNFVIYQKLDFDSDKDKLRRRVGGK
jgi:hypothetical protein